jgi:hypothetical protein
MTLSGGGASVAKARLVRVVAHVLLLGAVLENEIVDEENDPNLELEQKSIGVPVVDFGVPLEGVFSSRPSYLVAQVPLSLIHFPLPRVAALQLHGSPG